MVPNQKCVQIWDVKITKEEGKSGEEHKNLLSHPTSNTSLPDGDQPLSFDAGHTLCHLQPSLGSRHAIKVGLIASHRFDVRTGRFILQPKASSTTVQ
jgi:hypothetical protein